MSRPFLVTLVATVFVVCPRAQTGLSSSFAVPAGCTVSLWAESPLFYNPTAIDIDPQGRVWVTEAVNYRQWDGRNPGLHHDAGDRVMVVEDTDGDGVADKSTVFAQDKDLVSPLGICWLPDKVLVSCSPTVWAYYDDDHDLKADRKEVFLTGFGGPNHDHGAHSFSVGPDGRLYMALGNAGPHVVTDKSGWTLRSGSCYTGGGQFEAPNKPGLVSDDGRVYVGGLILRCNQDGTGLAVMAHNFRNPYEVAVDAFGDMWTFDNDDDGNQCCRATWVMEGGNYGYFSADGSRTWEADRRPGQSVQRAHWHQDDPGVCPTTLITGSGGPTGVCVYEGDALPEALRGALLCADAGRSCVYALRRVPDGAGFKLLPLDAAAGAPLVTGGPDGSEPLTGLLVSKPAKEGDETWHLFRPSDVCVAPDGSVIVADWFDPGVGGHRAQDQLAYGRLLRVSGSVQPPTLASSRQVAPATPGSLLESVSQPAQSQRCEALASLQRRTLSSGTKADGALALMTSAFSAARDAERPNDVCARMLFGYCAWERAFAVDFAGESTSPTLLEVGVRDALRVPRVRALLSAGVASSAVLSNFWHTAMPAELRELAPLVRDLPWQEAGGFLDLRRLAPDPDDWAALGLAWEGKDVDFARELAATGSPLQWPPFVAFLGWRLHPDVLVPAFAARAMSASLDRAAREQSLTALAFCTSREAGEAMLNAALAGPQDTRELAAWWVQHNDGNIWRDFGLAQHLLTTRKWTDDEIVWRSGPVTRGSVPVDLDVSGSRRIALVVTEWDNGNACDWADWVMPEFQPGAEVNAACQSMSAIRADGVLPWVSATAGWGSVHVGRNCAGGDMLVDGAKVWGIGTHAPSEIVFDVPEGLPGVRFVARAAVDDGGTRQPKAATAVEFLVYADGKRLGQRDRATVAARLRGELDVLRHPDVNLEARVAAAESLASDADGGALLLAEAAAGRLDALDPDPDVQRELTAALAEAIFRNPDLGVRALASEHFQRLNAPSLPPIADLVKLTGDRHAGQSLFFAAARCSSCHAVRGRGGDVGPDLSQIRTKYGRAELLDSILNPSAAIGAGFESVTLTLKDGSVLAGLLQADGAQVLLKDGTGVRHVVDAADIAERRASKLSLMPDDIAYTLQPQQLADLCAFLQHDPSTPPKLGPPIELWNGKDLTGWVGVPDTSAWSVRAVDGTPILHDEGQPIGYIRTDRAFTNFELTVEWRFPDPQRPGNSGVLLRVQAPDKVWPRGIESQLNSGDAGDIWNIDAFGMDVDPARTDGRRTVKLLPSSEKPLGEWNTYRITLRDGDLTLEVNGQVQNRARWCEELPGSIALQSEGAPIEFRRVTVREIGD